MTFKPVDTAIVIVVGPLIDDSDFKTLEEAIAYNAAGMDVSLIVEKTDGTTAVTAITLTTGGTSDWTHKDGGYYEVEITAAQNAEEGIAYVRGVCTGVLPFESTHYDIVPANSYDSLIKGTDVLHADMTQIVGTTQSAYDLQDFADAGYDPVFKKVQGVVLVDTTTANTDMVGTDNAALAATALTDVIWTDAKAGYLDATITSRNATTPPTVGEIRTEMESAGSKILAIEGDTHELQSNQANWATAAGFSTHNVADVKTAIEAIGSTIHTIAADVVNIDGEAMRGTNSANTTTPPTVIAIRTEMDDNSSKLTDILADTDDIGVAGAGLTDLGGMSTGMKTEVNGEIVDVIKTDTTTEPSQGAPPSAPTFEEMVAYLYFKLRNKGETTSTEDSMYNNAGDTKIMKATIGDNGITFTKQEYVSGV